MARCAYEYEEAELEEEQDGYEDDRDEECDEKDKRTIRRKGRKGSSASRKKRRRSDFIDDDEEEEDDNDHGGRGGGGRKKKPFGSQFLDLEADVDSDEEEEEEEEGEDGFFVDSGVDIGEEAGNIRERRPSFMDEEQEDVDEWEQKVKERFRSNNIEITEDATAVAQQELLPSFKDPRLWMVKCKIGHDERKEVVNLMQKYKSLHIMSVIALDHLKSYIYVEAYKEAHVIEACKGFRDFSAKIMMVPIQEMTNVLSVESKVVDLARGTWVRMKNKTGAYKGDLAKVVNVDNVHQKVTVKLIPRVDLQTLANKQESREVLKKKTIIPPPRFFNVDEAREMGIRVERKKAKDSGECYEMVDGLMFKDGFLYKTVAKSSINSDKIKPTFDELEKFQKQGDGNGDIASLLHRKKGHFMKGGPVIVVCGDLKGIKGWVEKVEEDIVRVKPKDETLGKTLSFREKELCKHFKLGDHVKVVSGKQEGLTGMVVKVDTHVLTILSDVLKKHIDVFSDDVEESSEITTGIIRIGDYELHDLVLLNDMSFGMIVRVEREAFQVLKGIPDKAEVLVVGAGEIKNKIDRCTNAQDRSNNRISSKDNVRVVEGPLKGKKGLVKHIYNGILFIHDRHNLEHAGFICTKSRSCLLAGGPTNSLRSSNEMHALDWRYGAPRSSSNIFRLPSRLPPRGPPSDCGGRSGGRGYGNELVGKYVRIRSGAYKCCLGRVTQVNGVDVRVELDSQMKNVTVNRDQIADASSYDAPFREARYSLSSSTPIHPSRTPLHPLQTPMRDPSGTSVHDSAAWQWHPTSLPMRV